MLLNTLAQRNNFSSLIELTTQVLSLINILWLPLCRINKFGWNTTLEDCHHHLYLWDIMRRQEVGRPAPHHMRMWPRGPFGLFLKIYVFFYKYIVFYRMSDTAHTSWPPSHFTLQLLLRYALCPIPPVMVKHVSAISLVALMCTLPCYQTMIRLHRIYNFSLFHANIIQLSYTFGNILYYFWDYHIDLVPNASSYFLDIFYLVEYPYQMKSKCNKILQRVILEYTLVRVSALQTVFNPFLQCHLELSLGTGSIC